MSSHEHIKSLLPDFAKDTRINLGVIGGSTGLTTTQAWGAALAAAAATRQPTLIHALAAESALHLTEEAKQAALAAATIMAMNNVYYRFTHFMQGQGDYAAMPARLRMQVIGKPGVDHLDFELWCLAVSAINGCASCVQSHEAAVVQKGGNAFAVQDAVRIAAVMLSVAVGLDAAAAIGASLGAAATH
jgi:lipoyl-dependent peroxiredoxin subunit D